MAKDINELIADDFIRHSIDLDRFAAGERLRTLNALRELEDELLTKLKDRAKLTNFQAARTEALLQQTQATIAKRYKKIRADRKSSLETVYEAEKNFVVQTANNRIGSSVMTVFVDERVTRRAVDGTLINGAPSAVWWNNQANGLTQRFENAVRTGILAGETNDQIARRIRGTRANNFEDGIMSVTRREANALVRTSVQSVANKARQDTFEDNADIIQKVQQRSTLDTRTTTICKSYAGLVWKMKEGPNGIEYIPDGHDKAFANVDRDGGLHFGPPRHWNCLPLDRDALITSGGGITSVCKRWFDGDLFTIQIAGDREITCTPNHLIATNRGWVAAKDIQLADKIFTYGGSERERISNGNNDDIVTTLHDLTKAAFDSGKMFTVPVPLSPEDFHGDVAENEVGVIAVDGGLSIVGGLSQVAHDLFKIIFNRRRFARTVQIMGFCHFLYLLLRFFSTASYNISGVGKLLSFFRRRPCHSSKLLFAPISDFDSVFFKDCCKPFNPGSGSMGDFFKPDTALVESNSIVGIKSFAFHGLVGSLSTESGWYAVNSIVTHNCRSTLVPITASWEDLAGKKIKPKGAKESTFQKRFEERLKKRGFTPDQIKGIKAKTRASMNGQVPADLSYEDWLKTQSDAVQIDALGPERWRLWKEGRITNFRQLTDNQGRPLTIDQLVQRSGGKVKPTPTKKKKPMPKPTPTKTKKKQPADVLL